MNQKIGISYFRIAATDQSASDVEKESTRQKKIESYASEQEILIVRQYADIGYSGLDMDRPSVKQILNDLRANEEKIDCLLVDSTASLSRDTVELMELLKQLNQYVESVISVDEGELIDLGIELDYNAN
ncbi:recombinase family protein [Sporosarcina sp. P2]|uniref:recombinase family protein n=1 Tax=Sporosarcina sp. P2 TaxID=2048251 RepID=UPI00130457E1|nr:recombinase family protein [Sporosarcina sp. P2]